MKLLDQQAPEGWFAINEFALPLGTDGRVPDVAVVRSGAPVTDTSKRYPVGPEWFGLVVEVVSPRTAKTDRFLKPAEYAAAGVPLFWRVELLPEVVIHGFRLEAGAYVPTQQPEAPWGPVTVDVEALTRPE